MAKRLAQEPSDWFILICIFNHITFRLTHNLYAHLSIRIRDVCHKMRSVSRMSDIYL